MKTTNTIADMYPNERLLKRPQMPERPERHGFASPNSLRSDISCLSVIFGCLLLCVGSLCSAQVPVFAQLTDGSGSVSPTSFLHFQLENCGNNFAQLAPEAGTFQNPWVVVQTAFDLKPNQPDGSIVGQVLPNDQIMCGNVASTYYLVTAMKNATTPVSPVSGQPFLICSSSAPATMPCSNPGGTAWNPALQQPMFQPVPPGLVQMYGNNPISQSWTQAAGTEAFFNGTFDFTTGIQAGPVTFSSLANLAGSITGGTVLTAGSGCVPGALIIGPPNLSGGIQAQGSYTCSPAGGLSGVVITINGSGYTSAPTAFITTGTGTLKLNWQGFTNLVYVQDASPNTSPCVGSGMGAWASFSQGTWSCWDGVGNGGNGTVTGFASTATVGNILTTTVSNPTTNPNQTLTQISAGHDTIFGNLTGSTALASYNLMNACAADGAHALTYASGSGFQCTVITAASGILPNPSNVQHVIQPVVGSVSTQLDVNNFAFIRYVTSSWNWLQTDVAGSIGNLASPGSNTLTLTPCPDGIDTNASGNHYVYDVRIAGTGTAEQAPVTGGSCTSGATSGTIIVTTLNAHSAGFTVGSATSGVQEAFNDAWSSDVCTNAITCTAPYLKLMAGTNYNFYSTLYMRGRGSLLDGLGALVVTSTRDRGIYIGTTAAQPGQNKIQALTIGSSYTQDGVQISSVSAASGVYTITTATNHPFSMTANNGGPDRVVCEIHSQNDEQHWMATVTSVPSATQFTVAFGSATFSTSATTFGWCNLENTAIENGSQLVAITDLAVTQASSAVNGHYSNGITNDNDQHLTIERPTSPGGTNAIQSSANWPNGAFVYQRTDQGQAGIVYLNNGSITGMNCYDGGGNGFFMTANVCQGFPMFGVRYNGGLQSAVFTGNYQESTGGTNNPLYSPAMPSQMGVLVGGGNGQRSVGLLNNAAGWTPQFFASGGGSGAQRNYFVIPKSSTDGVGPLLYIGSAQPANSGVSVNLQWPCLELQDVFGHSLGTLTWDVLITTGTSNPPFGTGNFSYTALQGISAGNCANGMATATDTQTALASYTVPAQQFTPVFWYWGANWAINNTVVFQDNVPKSPDSVASQGTTSPAFIANRIDGNQGIVYESSPLWVIGLTGNTINSAELKQRISGGPANQKGDVNWGVTPSNYPKTFETWVDSNLSKTKGTPGHQPANDANDTAFGAGASGDFYTQAQTSISDYLGVIPSGSNWAEQITSSGHTFTGSLKWPSGLGTINELQGPPDQPFNIITTGGNEDVVVTPNGSGLFALGYAVQGSDLTSGTNGELSNTYQNFHNSSTALSSLTGAQLMAKLTTSAGMVTIDPNTSLSIPLEMDVGAATGSTPVQTVIQNGGAASCTGTSGNCIALGQIGRWKSNFGASGSAGSLISDTGSSNITSLVTNQVNATTFDLEDITMTCAGAGILQLGEVWLNALEGKAKLSNDFLQGCNNQVDIALTDNASTNDNNNTILNNVAMLGGGSTGTSLIVASGTGTGTQSEFLCEGCSFGDFGTGTVYPATLIFDGTMAPISGSVNTSNGAIGGCSSNCVQATGGLTFGVASSGMPAGTNLNINGTWFQTAATPVDSTHVQVTAAPGTQTGVPLFGYSSNFSTHSITSETLLNPYDEEPSFGNGALNAHEVISIRNVRNFHMHGFLIGAGSTNGLQTCIGVSATANTSNGVIDLSGRTGGRCQNSVLDTTAASCTGNGTPVAGCTANGTFTNTDNDFNHYNPGGQSTFGRVTIGNETVTGTANIGKVSAAVIGTVTNCSSSASPAVCGSAAAGSVTVAAAATTVVVDTTAVTANSQIQLQWDSSLGTKLGSITCNTTPTLLAVTARSPGTSFTITTSAPTTNPACISYNITN